MNSLRPLILITPCIIPGLLWTCLRTSYPRSHHAIILKRKIKNFMSGRSFEFYNNLGRFNFKITTQKSGRWNKPVIVITVVTA
jgi:hypothetical protein